MRASAPNLFDAVVVGSGAGGSAAAYALSRRGLRVAVLEKGPHHAAADYPDDEVMAIYDDWFGPNLERDPHIVVTAAHPAGLRSSIGYTAQCVGGGTVHMGGFLYRFHPVDFCMASTYGGDSDLVDWPFDYAELEPWYGAAEWALGVAGCARRHPRELPRSRPYPMPPLAAHAFSHAFDVAAETLGWHLCVTPRALNSVARGERARCALCHACSGYGCRHDAKNSADRTLLADAIGSGLVTLRSQAHVTRVLTDSAGHARGVLYRNAAGEEHELHARSVIVACSAVESARLLLLSADGQRPEGLGNSSGHLGRHLQFHSASLGVARFRRQADPALVDQAPFLGRSSFDFYRLPEGVAPIAKGGVLRFDPFNSQPIQNAQLLLSASSQALYGAPFVKQLRSHFEDHACFEFEAFHDFLPNEDTWMQLDPVVRDGNDLPVARIHLGQHEQHAAVGRHLSVRAEQMFAALGAEDLWLTQVGGLVPYLAQGTCRAGHDPATSVIDGYGAVHDTPGLFVVDGSAMPTSGGAPPTLTILAFALRAGDHISRRLREHSL